MPTPASPFLTCSKPLDQVVHQQRSRECVPLPEIYEGDDVLCSLHLRVANQLSPQMTHSPTLVEEISLRADPLIARTIYNTIKTNTDSRGGQIRSFRVFLISSFASDEPSWLLLVWGERG